MISYYVSQQTDFCGNTLFERLEEHKTSDERAREVFKQLVRMSFYKRVKENTDERYHRYLPEADSAQLVFEYMGSPGEEGKDAHPDAALINDKLNSRESAANIKAFLEGGLDL